MGSEMGFECCSLVNVNSSLGSCWYQHTSQHEPRVSSEELTVEESGKHHPWLEN